MPGDPDDRLLLNNSEQPLPSRCPHGGTDTCAFRRIALAPGNDCARLGKLARFDLLILGDFSYARRDQDETWVLFELIAQRYERKSTALTSNAPFWAWDEVFPDKAITIAAVDASCTRP